MAPPTAFVFARCHRRRVAAADGPTADFAVTSTMSVAIAALILGKAVLIAGMLPFINRLPDKP